MKKYFLNKIMEVKEPSGLVQLRKGGESYCKHAL